MIIRVAGPPLFWAAPEVRGPGADFGSGQMRSALASGLKGRLKAVPAPDTENGHFDLCKIKSIIQIFFGSYVYLS